MKVYLFTICIFIISCQSAPSVEKDDSFLLPVTEIRYEELSGQIRAILKLNHGDSLTSSQLYSPAEGRSPLFMGSPMQARPASNQWIERRDTPWPDQIKLSIPHLAETGNRDRTEFEVSMKRPFADSLPSRIALSEGSRFAFGNHPLEDNESVLIFFETRDWSPGVKRILIAGPTSTEYARLPPESLTELPPGNYDLYLVKQKLSRDTVPGLRASTQIEFFTESKSVEVF